MLYRMWLNVKIIDNSDCAGIFTAKDFKTIMLKTY